VINKKNNYFLKKYKTDSHKNETDTDKKIEKNFFIKLEKSPKKLVRPDKRTIAAFLVILGTDTASKIIKNLSETEAEILISEMLKIEKLDQNVIKKIEEEIGEINQNYFVKDLNLKEYAFELLAKSFPAQKSSKIFNSALNYKAKSEKYEKPNLSFIENLTEKEIYDLLSDESVSVISAILTLLEPVIISKVIPLFPQEKKIEIIKRISRKIELNPDVVETIVEKLKEKSKKTEKISVKSNTKDHLAKILKLLPFSKKNEIIDAIKSEDSSLAEEIENSIFNFNDIVKIPTKSLIYALKKCKDNEIAFMLKGTDMQFREKLLKCVSQKRRLLIEEEIEYLGKVKKVDVDKKQKDFIDYLKKLEAKGKIVLFPDNEKYVE